MRSESDHHKTLDATLQAVTTLLERQALVNQLVARTDTRKHALVQALVERQHAVELEKKLNSLHPVYRSRAPRRFFPVLRFEGGVFLRAEPGHSVEEQGAHHFGPYRNAAELRHT